MFSGIVQTIGRVVAAPRRGKLEIAATLPGGTPRLGESIAINGVCLTVARKDGATLRFDVSDETLAVTTLGDVRAGTRVNIERALALGDRIGGHLVSGHVDGVCRLLLRASEASGVRDTYELPEDLSRFVARKGSVTLDGVSLTVTRVEPRGTRKRPGHFQVALIPHTLAVTTLGERRTGDRLNLEVDLVARYLDALHPSRPGRRA